MRSETTRFEIVAWGRRLAAQTPGPGVVFSGTALVIAALAFRTWAIFPSWFYLDDYKLLYDAQQQVFGLSYLLEPHNSNLMPGGRVLAALVESTGSLNWPMAAGVMLALEAAAALAALWSFFTVFGRRWAALVPLTLYLTSAVTFPVMMWWTAGVNQVPLQGAFFLAVGAWVQYLRSKRPGWLIMTVGAVGLGLFFYVKALLLFPVLAFLALAYFSSGSLIPRSFQAVRAYWPGAAAGLILALTYIGYYLGNVTSPFEPSSARLVGQIADSMLGTAFTTAVIGGPWQWATLAPPNSFAAPPSWTVHAAWVVISLTIVAGFLMRERTLRAWSMLAGYLAMCLALLVASRGPAYGAILGLEYRYLTDAACMSALCVALVFLGIPGAAESSKPRAPAWLERPLPRLIPIALVGIIAFSGVASSVRYVIVWHTQNESDAYVHALKSSLDRAGTVDLVDLPVPEGVYSGAFAPHNRLSRIATLLDVDVRFPDHSSNLGVINNEGVLTRAQIKPGTQARPGPKANCGWQVDAGGKDIPLAGRAFEWVWWARIGYLYSEDSDVIVRAGRTVVKTRIEPGVNSLYVRLDGGFDRIRIDGIEPGTVLCVDSIEVGQVTPGGTFD